MSRQKVFAQIDRLLPLRCPKVIKERRDQAKCCQRLLPASGFFLVSSYTLMARSIKVYEQGWPCPAKGTHFKGRSPGASRDQKKPEAAGTVPHVPEKAFRGN